VRRRIPLRILTIWVVVWRRHVEGMAVWERGKGQVGKRRHAYSSSVDVGLGVRCCMARGCGGARSEVEDKGVGREQERWCRGGRLKVGGVGVSSPWPRVCLGKGERRGERACSE
jgi:hypothetical protein